MFVCLRSEWFLQHGLSTFMPLKRPANEKSEGEKKAELAETAVSQRSALVTAEPEPLSRDALSKHANSEL